MKRREFLKSSLALSGAILTGASGLAAAETKKHRPPNVLFIAVDDMNDWTDGLGGYDGTVHTPNQQRLAWMGVGFTNAHTASSICCPSRTAVMTGLRPSTTGVYNNGQWWKPHMPDAVTIPVHFRNHDYYAAGAGKIFHHTPGFNPPCQWDEYQDQVFDDPWTGGAWSESRRKLYGYAGPRVKYPDYLPLNGPEGAGWEEDWGALPDKKDGDYGDQQATKYAVEFLKRKHDRPFFLGVGFYRPHLPWYVPQKYFDMYPLDTIKLPIVPDDDLEDIPEEGKRLSKARRADFEKIKAANKWKEAVQAYLASITFADAQVGHVLDALEKSPYTENTVIIFWSDHGWHLGEKNHWHKMTLWEEATRVPFYMAGPGIASGVRCVRPVGLIDIYPTLIELCGLAEKPELDGKSLVGLLKNPTAKWDRPAITEYHPGQFAVRSERWRYIRYQDGTEELYDHRVDPNEWCNLAVDEKYTNVKKEHAKWIPASVAKPAPSKGAYEVDWRAYTWTNKKTGIVIDGNK